MLFDSFDPFTGPSRRDRKAARLQEEGEAAPGTLVGIKVRTSDETTDFCFAIEVRAATPFRVQIRQANYAGRELRLGMELPMRHDGKDAVIAWDPTGPAAWKPVRKVEDGIDDSRLQRPKGRETDAELLGTAPLMVFGMTTEDRHARLRIDGEERRVKVRAPEYASHLLAPGTTWPVSVDGKRVRVDWIGALDRHGWGVGVPTPPPTDEEPAGASVEDRLTDAVDGLMARFAPKHDADGR